MVAPTPSMKTLTSRQAARQLGRVPLWSRRASTIRRRYEFPGFPAAVRFVDRVARLAEAANHHPDIDIRWNKVTLALTTHDSGGLTGKDFSLARQCDRAFTRLAGR